MTILKVMIKNKNVVPVDVDLYNNTLNDLIGKLGNITVNLVTIGGEDIKSDDFSKKLYTFDLEEGEMILISDYYNGGNKFISNN